MTAIHFLHIGKTGGTALIESFRSAGSLIGLPAPVRFHSHDKGLTHVPQGEKVFFFLRDPLSRFVSGFYSRQRKGMPRYNSPWSEEETLAFEKFKTANELGEALSSESAQLRTAANSAMQSIQHVKDRYSYWLVGLEYLASRESDLIYIGFQEDMENSVSCLAALLNVRLTLPSDDVQAHRNPASVDRKLSPVAIENLSKWYEEDYELYNQCKLLATERRWNRIEAE